MATKWIIPGAIRSCRLALFFVGLERRHVIPTTLVLTSSGKCLILEAAAHIHWGKGHILSVGHCAAQKAAQKSRAPTDYYKVASAFLSISLNLSKSLLDKSHSGHQALCLWTCLQLRPLHRLPRFRAPSSPTALFAWSERSLHLEKQLCEARKLPLPSSREDVQRSPVASFACPFAID